jgi:hypothetical protein
MCAAMDIDSKLSNGSKLLTVDSSWHSSRHSSCTSSSGVALAAAGVSSSRRRRKRRLFPTVAALPLIHCCLGLAFAQEVQQKQPQAQSQEKDGLDGEQDDETKSLEDVGQQTSVPTLAPTVVNFDEAEEEHSSDAFTALALNATLIVCVMMAYYVKKHKIYYLPESAGELKLRFCARRHGCDLLLHTRIPCSDGAYSSFSSSSSPISFDLTFFRNFYHCLPFNM